MKIEVPLWRKLITVVPWVVLGIWCSVAWMPYSVFLLPLCVVMAVYNGIAAFQSVEVTEDGKVRRFFMNRVTREVDLANYRPEEIRETTSTLLIFFTFGAKFVNDANPRGTVIGMRLMDSIMFRDFIKMIKEKSAVLHGIAPDPAPQPNRESPKNGAGKYDS